MVLIRCWWVVPGMLTHRSRGIDSSVALVDPGSMRTNIMVSDRWPATWEPVPNWARSAAEVSLLRLSLPTTRIVMGPLRLAAPPMPGMDSRLIWPNRQLA